MKKIKYTKFFIEKYLLSKGEAYVKGLTQAGDEKLIGTFYDLETANFIKKLLTATLIKKGK